MKTAIQLTVCFIASAIFVGCATGGMGHGMMMSSGMSCSKCACGHFEKDAAKPMACKMCGHSADEHNKTDAKSDEHKEHQH